MRWFRPLVSARPLRHRPVSNVELAPRMASAVTTVVILCFFGVALTYAVSGGFGALKLAVFGVLMLMLLGLQFCHSFPARAPRWARQRGLTLALQTVLTFAPFVFFGAAWLGMPGFLCSSCLLVLRPALAWAAFGLAVVATGAVQFLVGYGVAQLPYNTVATVLTGLVVYGLSRLTGVIAEVQAARDELVRVTLAQERVRFARDLHDLLGFSLSTITLKCELAHRLVRVDPERAESEITEIVQATRQASAEVRSVASSYLRMSLERELEAASSLLRAVGIHAEVRVATGPVSPAVDVVLATVLREGVTNMLRHSKAQNCVIEAAHGAGRVHLVIANDGLRDARSAHFPEASGVASAGGNGLSSLAARAAAIGGRLDSGERPDGWFRLAVDLPAQATGQDGEDALTTGRHP
ncbi:histidine kinase [Streptomyces actinomycinicus]|uniref:Histidine kinase n=1 Tax=Streptomyces actinomycinicus TaxID=1695166 RepID=A0A937ET38_9ACTN|nr:histidine kinase [Streptomyces actinomycinicus]MBL1087605.1 histidine kinase [Streptomyces actinomycinicus]